MSNYSFFKSNDFVYSHMLIESPKDFPLHNHDVCELIYFKKGDVSYMVEGKIFTPSKNSLLLTHPLENHAVFFNSHVSYERYNILFDEKNLDSCICERISPNTILLNTDSNTLISDLFNKMDYYCNNFEGYELQVILMHLVEEILYNLVLVSHDSDLSSMYTTNPFIQAAIKYINQNIHIPINVNTLCKELHMSKSHLHHLFNEHLMVTPQKYILSKKLTIAQRELRLGRKPTDVYTDCGFADYTTFFRAYKKFFGHSPSDEINMHIVRKIQS